MRQGCVSAWGNKRRRPWRPQGTDIHFAPGHYNPHTTQGQQVLAHELTHVVQQRTGRVQPPARAAGGIVHNPVLEAEAARMAHSVGIAPPVMQLRGNKAARRYTTPNWTGIGGDAMKTHIMQGEVNSSNEPIGLHAYDDGSLPNGVRVMRTVGNVNSVHWIWWTMGAAYNHSKCKWSSMFPKQLTEAMITAILQKEENQTGTTVNCSELGMPYSGSITIGRSGATRFPEKRAPRECWEDTLHYQGYDYAVTNHLGE